MASFFFTQDDSARIDTQACDMAGGRDGGAPGVRVCHLAEITSISGGAGRRAEVAPPSLFSRNRPAWKRVVIDFWCWLWDIDELPRRPATTSGLGKVKAEFNAALWDLQSLHANEVRDHVEHARSLRELWHLRAQVFKVISVHRGQIEAQLRLDGLDAHFPVKSSRRQDESRAGRPSTW
jgi:hypothetical protein